MVEELLLKKNKWLAKENYSVYKQHQIRRKELNPDAINELISKNGQYGHIVCRCEQSTEGEVVDSIHRILGAKTIDGVKKRCRPGMGRCQGSFCQGNIIEILARELGVKPLDIKLNDEGSLCLMEEV